MTTPFPILAAEAQRLLSSRFAIGNEIAKGGQGLVIRATRRALLDGTPTNDDVALKLHHDPQQDERIEREISVMLRLRHSCLANLLEHGVLKLATAELRYIAWEFIDGETLAQAIARGPLSPKTVAVVGRDIATAIREIWRELVVHRDIKPRNIMMRTGQDSAVLIDLGCARHLNDSTLTGAGLRVGTLGYMSPEQARADHQLTCFSDVFSLGLSLTEALTGRHPTNHQQNVISVSRIQPSVLASLAPSGLVQLLDQMLQLRPAFRPEPEHLADAFDRLAQRL